MATMNDAYVQLLAPEEGTEEVEESEAWPSLGAARKLAKHVDATTVKKCAKGYFAYVGVLACIAVAAQSLPDMTSFSGEPVPTASGMAENLALATNASFVRIPAVTMIANMNAMNETGNDYELRPKANKIMLLFIEMSFFGAMGVDRWFLGQSCCGWAGIKFITGGGFGLWAIIDAFLIFWNIILFYQKIDVIGMHAEFENVHICGYLYLFLFLFKIYHAYQWIKSMQEKKKDPPKKQHHQAASAAPPNNQQK